MLKMVARMVNPMLRTIKRKTSGAANIWLLGSCLVLAGLAVVGWALAAEPGSKEDPLATVGYVARHAQFVRQDVTAGQSLRLMPGAELIIVEPMLSEISVREFDPLRDTLLDLTEGKPVQLARITSGHHYINGSNHDIFLRPDEETTMLMRGDWR